MLILLILIPILILICFILSSINITADPKIVIFEDGQYGVRRFTIKGYEYLRLPGASCEWEKLNWQDKGTLEQAQDRLQEILKTEKKDYGKVTVVQEETMAPMLSKDNGTQSIDLSTITEAARDWQSKDLIAPDGTTIIRKGDPYIGEYDEVFQTTYLDKTSIKSVSPVKFRKSDIKDNVEKYIKIRDLWFEKDKVTFYPDINNDPYIGEYLLKYLIIDSQRTRLINTSVETPFPFKKSEIKEEVGENIKINDLWFKKANIKLYADSKVKK